MESKQRGVRRGKQQLGLLSWGRAAAHRSGGGLAAVFAIAAIVVGLAAWTSQALADFPYIGDGTSGNPASWALAPGHVDPTARFYLERVESQDNALRDRLIEALRRE